MEQKAIHPDSSVSHFQELMSSLLAMAWIVEARDPYTGGHLWRVSQYSRLLASAAGLNDTDIARVTVGGFLHDLGKIGIPDHILNKRDRLSREEYDIMKTHPRVGLRMLAAHPLKHIVQASVVCHHERPDGLGYPSGLTLSSIPRDARIVAICDAFDAMTSTRPYRKGMAKQEALTIIRANLGKQFHKDDGEVFLQLGEDKIFDHIIGHSDNGIPLHHCPMCGPTLLVTREQQAGSLIYCRSCKAEFEVTQEDHRLSTRATGRTGNASDLEVIPDTALITRLVNSLARSVSLPKLLASVRE